MPLEDILFSSEAIRCSFDGCHPPSELSSQAPIIEGPWSHGPQLGSKTTYSFHSGKWAEIGRVATEGPSGHHSARRYGIEFRAQFRNISSRHTTIEQQQGDPNPVLRSIDNTLDIGAPKKKIGVPRVIISLLLKIHHHIEHLNTA